MMPVAVRVLAKLKFKLTKKVKGNGEMTDANFDRVLEQNMYSQLSMLN